MGSDKNKFSACQRKTQRDSTSCHRQTKGQRAQESDFMYKFFSLFIKKRCPCGECLRPIRSIHVSMVMQLVYQREGRLLSVVVYRRGSWDLGGHRSFSILFFSGVTFPDVTALESESQI